MGIRFPLSHDKMRSNNFSCLIELFKIVLMLTFSQGYPQTFEVITLTSPNETLTDVFSAFGSSVSDAGDVNMDGFADVIVGALGEDPGSSPLNAGRAYIFSGEDGSLLFELVSPNEEFAGLFGYSVSGAGDVNMDGFADVIVGANTEDPGSSPDDAGRAYIFSGADGSLLFEPVSPHEEYNGRFGYSVSSAGDVNMDGFGDVIVGAPQEGPATKSFSGRAYIFSGADGSLIFELVSPNEEEVGFFGNSVSGVGDINMDQIPDVIVGAPQDGSGGRAYIFSGADGGLLFELISPNEESNGQFGESVSYGGNINMDGVTDFIVGAPEEDPGASPEDAGRVYLFSGVDGSPLLELVSPHEKLRGQFGRGSLSVAGDINLDGRTDVIVGRDNASPANSPTDAGRAYIFSGADGSLMSELVSPDEQVAGYFGASVSVVGDVNINGKVSVIVGASGEDPASDSILIVGRAYIFNFVIEDSTTFTRITTGPVVNDEGFGCSWGDHDNDGDLDLFVGICCGLDNFLYQNNGDGTFTKITTGDIVNDGGASQGSNSWGDYDNDGDLDSFVANALENNFLYQNNGNGSFTRIISGNIVNDGGFSLGASWGDYDNDGDLDLFVANSGVGTMDENNFLYQNNGDGSFTTITTGVIVNDGGYSSGCSWGDYDNDGDLDLFVANDVDSRNFLYGNNGDGTFTRVITGAIFTDTGYSQGGSWGDYDNDGDLDLFVTNSGSSTAENNFLYQNNGDGSFSKITTGDIVTDGGYSHGSSWGDYDNDGDLDLFVANSQGQNNFLYQNNGDSSFTKVSTGDIVNNGGISIGASWGDYDNDGDLDLFVGNAGGENNFLYRNEGNNNHWINIFCVGTISNTSAIGTKIRLKATINGKPVWQLREISGQTGFASQNSLNAEFGLGDATIIDSIKVEWPNGIVQVLTNINVDQFLTIIEAEPDIEGPVIFHTPASTATSGQSQTISADLTDNVGLQSATLFYRRGGASSFDSTAMNNPDGGETWEWEEAIPANFITERGAEYYISAQDAAGNTTTFPATNPQANPQVIRITSSNLTFSSPSFAYRLISVPIDLDNASPASVLEDDLGTYDNTQWRLWRYIDGSNVEFPNTGNLQPGRGFWLITRSAKTLATGAGVSVTTGENFIISLQPGWNQIGNPFAFTVNWDDVIKNGNLQDVLVGYQGSSNDATGYDYTRMQLLPFQGYFVNNQGGTTTIEIPPVSAGPAVTAKHNTSSPGLTDLQSDEWALQITAQSDRFLDKDNYIGVLHNASDVWDRNDFSEAPFFDSYVSLYFPHHDWETYPGLYTGDFRSLNSEGHFWDFHVKSNIPDSEVLMTLRNVQNLPSGMGVVLIDKASRISINLLEENTYTFPVGEEGAERDFRIVVGKADFIESNDLDIAGIPKDFALSQNYPNPFNPETRINYQLPSTSQVKIVVYNLLGQLIRTLLEVQQGAGRYVVTWNGRTESGLPAASGIYLVRMQAGNFVAVRKMLLAR